ncbi:unnamed protein product [Bathycoccus prasinos]
MIFVRGGRPGGIFEIKMYHSIVASKDENTENTTTSEEEKEKEKEEKEEKNLQLVSLLEEKMARRERENMETSSHLRRELLEKEREVLKAKQLLNQERKNYRERAMIANHQRVTEMDRLNADNEKVVAQLQLEIQELKTTIANSREHVENRAKFDREYMKVSQELENAKLKIENIDEEREEAISALTAKMQNELEQNVQKATREHELAMEEKLEANVRKIFAHNRRMAEALRLHVAETDKLREDIEAANSEKVTLSRLLDEAKEETKLSAKKALTIGKDLNTARVSLGELNEECEELKTAFDEERNRWMDEKSRATEELREREKYFADAISLRNKELLELRKLAQAYVNERNDCEAFLISCLDDVRERKMKEQETKTSASSSSFSSSSSSSIDEETQQKIEQKQEKQEKNALVVVDVDDGEGGQESSENDDYVHVSAPTSSAAAAAIDFTKLSWKEKEAVLFELFRKIETSVVSE